MLTTPRLRLRPWREDDLNPFAALNADPRVREFFPTTLTREESAASLQRLSSHIDRHGFGFWAVEIVNGPPFIGFAGLCEVPFLAPFTPCIELGYRLAFDYWG